MELLLQNYVLSEINSNIGFLSARACWIFGRYSTLDYQNKAFVKTICLDVFNCLSHKELVVKIKAAETISLLLNHDVAFVTLK